MENASKALIIAGSILVSILLVTIGIVIYRQGSSVMKGDQMSQAEIQSFNEKFTQYAGTKVKGSTVKSLVEAVSAYDHSDQASEDTYITINAAVSLSSRFDSATTSKIYTSGKVGTSGTEVQLTYSDPAPNPEYGGKFKDTSIYTVECLLDNTGRVGAINIKKNG